MDINQNVYLVEQMLLGKISPDEAILQYKQREENDDNEIKPIGLVIGRMIHRYAKFATNGSGLNDFLSILRQYLLIENLKVKINEDLFNKISNHMLNFGFKYYRFGNEYEISCTSDYPNWLKAGDEINEIYQYKATSPNRVVGDGYLYRMTGFKEYTSKGQKYLVDAALNQEPGTTIIAALRTGGGKSLVFQMPAFYDESGLTLVIVPTVALTIDQQQNITAAYGNENFKARVIHSGVTREERYKIEAELKAGEISLLYTSPEVVMRSWFKNILYEIAEKGLLNRLVIDEAHIVEEWGDLFRIDFQMLSVIRKKLLQLTNDSLKTLLVSATLSEEVTKLLGVLFSEKDKLIEIRTDTLRDEILYYYQYCDSIYKRLEYFEQLLPLLPRPFIVYVGTKEDAELYYQKIVDSGFLKVVQFTGDTATNKRERILRKWKDDEIDIVVATSAFGVGVDKKDVRAVVHVYMPPSIDRFYQEVGRGGRDGYPSLSISLISHLEDYKLMNHLTSNKVLTVEKIIEKWNDLITQPKSKEAGDRVVVNTMIKPLNRKEIITGKVFANWYGYVLLFFYRNGIIDLLDVEMIEDANYDCLIQIKDLTVTNNNDALFQKLSVVREIERSKVNEQMQLIRNMFHNKNKRCYGSHLENVYPYSTRACRSCPPCREVQRKPKFSTPHITVNEGRKLFIEQMKSKSTFSHDHNFKESMYEYEGEFNIRVISDFYYNVLIVESREHVLMESLPHHQVKVYEYDELLCGDDIVINGVVCVIVNSEPKKADRIYKYMEETKRIVPTNKYIYVAQKDLIIPSRSRKLRDLIDGPINESWRSYENKY